jgi:hypothetical protein
MWRPTLRLPAITMVLAVFVITARGPCALGDDPSPVPSDPVFRALRTDGTTVSGRIRQLGPNRRVLLSDGTIETAIPFDRLVTLTREGDQPSALPDGSVVLFPDGDRLRTQIGNSTETALETHPPLLGDADLAVPLDSLLALLLVPGSDPAAQEDLLGKLREEPRKSEVLLLNNDDRQTGGFLGLKTDKVAFQRDNGPPETDRTRVSALEFDPTLVKYPEPKDAPWLELTFLDGSRLGAISTTVDQGQLVLETRFGATMRVPLRALAGVHVKGGPVVYLATRKEALAEYVGYVGEHRKSFGRNKTADGRVLKLGGRPYDRGLGTQSRTLLAYRLEPGDQRFQATVGLDDRAGPLGSVVFRVLVDGKERASTPSMTARDAPRSLDVDLTGARILILATEFGDRGDVQDLADWVEARIIRATK